MKEESQQNKLPGRLPVPRAAKLYQDQKFQTEAAAQRVLDAYEAGLTACARRDGERVIGALELLLDALDYEEQELAEKFETVYVHCLAQVPRGDFEEVARVLLRLRDMWAESMEIQ